MPSLLEKLRPFRRNPESKPRAKSPGSPAVRRWLWIYIAASGIVLLVAFFWITSSRLLQAPIELTYGPRDAAFASAFGPIVGAEFVGGNSVEILVNGDRFFPAMLNEIRGAQKSVTLETYIWAPGKISDEFIAALCERARNGVKVNVLVDGMGTLKFKKKDGDTLRAAGVELMKYGREHFYNVKANINHRTHRKLLIVDGKVGFTGGMCIDDHWLGNADSEKRWRETCVRVQGPVVGEMQAVFATNWLQTTAHLLLGEEYFPKLSPAGTSRAQCFKSGPGEGPENVRIAYLFAIAGSRETIDIANAYFVPDDLAIDMLVAARQRGVRVRLILPAINDSRFGRAVSRSRWGRLLAAGVEFYQYEPAMFHCKTMVVDDIFVTIGSANFDNRSFTINDEVALNTIDPAVAAEHRRMFEDDLKHSSPFTRADFEAQSFATHLVDQFCGLFRSQF